MAHQTTVKHVTEPSIAGVISEIGDLGSNLTLLATLQARLAGQDLRESATRALPAFIAVAALLPLAFASATVAAFGLASWLTASWNIPQVRAMLYVSALGAVTCVVLGVVIVHYCRISLIIFRRSREELERNIAWLGTVLLHSGR